MKLNDVHIHDLTLNPTYGEGYKAKHIYKIDAFKLEQAVTVGENLVTFDEILDAWADFLIEHGWKSTGMISPMVAKSELKK